MNKKENNQYEVEKIIEDKKINKKTFYLVKWKNFSHNNNTWEPYQNVKNCQAFLKYTNGKSQ